MITIAGTQQSGANQTVYESSQDLVQYADHIIEVQGGGAVVIQATMDKTQATTKVYSNDLAVQDMQSANRQTFVVSMTGDRNMFRLPGRFRGIKVLTGSANAVAVNVRISHRPAHDIQ